MSEQRKIGFATKAIHGRKHTDKHDPNDHNPYRTVSTPIFMTSTFAFDSVEHGAAIFNGESPDYTYTRIGNPTTAALESEVAYLEDAEAGVSFASGMAAISHLTFYLVKPGEKFLYAKTLYGGTHRFFGYACDVHFKMKPVAVDATNLDEIRAAIDKNTKMLFIETPSNPTLAVVDIAACAEIAHQHGVPLVVDNTFLTPYFQLPIHHGADFVVHSLTKYLTGHGDTVGGLVVGRAERLADLKREISNDVGGCFSPFNAWLVLRGIRTLPVRMERHNANAMEVAQFLAFHPKVEEVFYPGLRSNPYYELAKRQQRAPGGMLAFTVKGGRRAAGTLSNSVTLWTRAVSLGDVDSLISNPATTTHSTYSDDELRAGGIDPGLIRLSVGLEDVDDLIEDLRDALKKI
ncbi:MAG: aminotransferase class I/II-fold pyridoxal phosphate-dependent enzyme [Candidatus Lernaella stagnicola]|nr:aminotransferase class I/II-fold pyridoxal phosphate-dependent enzyme [Candidatus Lernaella stagnicola]